MKNHITPAVAIALLILATTCQVLSQEKADGLELSISMENTEIRLSGKTKVKVRLENKTGNTIYLKQSEAVSLYFEKLKTPPTGCNLTDCFVAHVSFKDKHVESDKFIEAEFDLKDLYWNDAISSSTDFKQPKNFFETVHYGKYRFYAFVRVPPNAWTLEDSKLIRLKSNEIKVST